MIALAVRDCFKFIESQLNQREYRVRVSYLEIYNEQIRDLLCPSTPSARIQILDDRRAGNGGGGNGVTVKGLMEEDVVSADHVSTATEFQVAIVLTFDRSFLFVRSYP